MIKWLKKLFKKNKKTYEEIKDISSRVLLFFLQGNGKSAEEKVELLNEVMEFCGVEAHFIQEKGKCGWEGNNEKDLIKAKELRSQLEKCWPRGDWESEYEAVFGVISRCMQEGL